MWSSLMTCSFFPFAIIVSRCRTYSFNKPISRQMKFYRFCHWIHWSIWLIHLFKATKTGFIPWCWNLVVDEAVSLSMIVFNSRDQQGKENYDFLWNALVKTTHWLVSVLKTTHKQIDYKVKSKFLTKLQDFWLPVLYSLTTGIKLHLNYWVIAPPPFIMRVLFQSTEIFLGTRMHFCLLCINWL